MWCTPPPIKDWDTEPKTKINKQAIKQFIARMFISVTLLMFIFLIAFEINGDKKYFKEQTLNDWIIALVGSFIIYIVLWLFFKAFAWAIKNI